MCHFPERRKGPARQNALERLRPCVLHIDRNGRSESPSNANGGCGGRDSWQRRDNERRTSKPVGNNACGISLPLPCVCNVADDATQRDIACIRNRAHHLNGHATRRRIRRAAQRPTALRCMGKIAGPDDYTMTSADESIGHKRVAHLAEALALKVVERVLYPDNHC